MRKFAFDTEFGTEAAALADASPNARRTLTREEAEALAADAFARGRAEAEAAATQRLSDAAATLAEAAARIEAGLAGEIEALREDARRLSLAIGRKIAQEALDGFGDARITAAIEAALEHFPTSPRLTALVSEADAPRIETAVREAAQRCNATITLRTSAAAERGDVTLEWGEGRIDFSRRDALAAIEAKIVQSLNAKDAP